MDTAPSDSSTHHVVAGIFGVYCSKCNKKVKLKGNSLVIPDEQTLRRHFKKNKCYTGPTPPNCYEVERELIRSQNAIRAAAVADNELGKHKIHAVFPSGQTTTHRAHACLKCGYSAKDNRDFKDHFGKRNQFGCSQVFDASPGKILVFVGRYDITCPKQMLDDAARGIFGTSNSTPNKRMKTTTNFANAPSDSSAINTTAVAAAPTNLMPSPPTERENNKLVCPCSAVCAVSTECAAVWPSGLCSGGYALVKLL